MNDTVTPAEPDDMREMWAVIDGVRGRRMDPAEVFSALKAKGIEVDWRTLARLGERLEWEQTPSEPLIEFVVRALEGLRGCRLLDPWANAGVLLAALTDATQPSSALGLVLQSPLLPVAEQLSPEAEWRVGDLVEQLDALKQQGREFDLVACASPWGLQKHGGGTGAVDQRVAKLSVDHRVVLASCDLLSTSGRGYFFLPNQFLLAVKPDGIRSSSSREGMPRVERRFASAILEIAGVDHRQSH